MRWTLRTRRLALAAAVAGTGLAMAAFPSAAQSFRPRIIRCPPCVVIANTFIHADVGANGTWVLGTTGGDPDSAADDDKILLYGFEPGSQSQVGTGYTTLRVSGAKGTFDLVHLDDAPQSSAQNRVVTLWRWLEPYRVDVTQTLEIQHNPFTGRRDLVDIRYDLANRDTVALAAGVRTLLDIRVGETDGAPYFVPGVGTVTTERIFVGADVPDYWLAFESKSYDPSGLRSVGVLRRRGEPPPDRFMIAWWPALQFATWDYPIDPTRVVTEDSAVAVYWDPATLPPGGARSVSTGYGLASNKGGSAFISAPVEAVCGDTVSVALFVNNFSTLPLTGGRATLTLPSGLALAAGETATKPLGDIAPGSTGSAVWMVEVGPATQGVLTIDAVATFDDDRDVAATTQVNVACTPTATAPVPSPTPTATPRPPTPTAAPPTPTPEGPPAKACAIILRQVPPAAISAALADPTRVRGWMELVNPSVPVGPNNPRKTWLSLQNLGVPYHPLFNPLVFKAWCP